MNTNNDDLQPHAIRLLVSSTEPLQHQHVLFNLKCEAPRRGSIERDRPHPAGSRAGPNVAAVPDTAGSDILDCETAKAAAE